MVDNMICSTERSGLNRSSPIPLYYQLQQAIQAQIEGEAWGASDTLPSESELCRTYGVSRTVVRQALEGLQRAGAINRVKGKGTFLAQRKIVARLLQDATGFQANMEAEGLVIRTRVLHQDVVAAATQVAQALEISVGAPVLRLERLRLLEGEPVFWGITHVPLDLHEQIAGEDFSVGSLNDILARRCGLLPVGGKRVIEATAASAREAEMLQLPIGAPLFRLFAVTRAQDGRPMECSQVWLRGDRTAFEVNLAGGETTRVQGQTDRRS